MKYILALILFAVALVAPVFAGTSIAFDAPVDCTHYVAGGGTAATIDLLSIDYSTGEVRFRLLDSSGNALGNGAVFGLTLTAPVQQADVKAAVVAAITAAG